MREVNHESRIVPLILPSYLNQMSCYLDACRLFSIDPSTARDLDDALSIENLGNGRWRVGVHIADVAHFIPPGSALDEAAAERATSVSMVQQVYHMLPRLLCEQLCSLHFGQPLPQFSTLSPHSPFYPLQGKVH